MARIRKASTTTATSPPSARGNVPDDPRWTSGFDLAAGADVLIHDAQYFDHEHATHVGAWNDCAQEMAADAEALVRRTEADLRAQGVRTCGHAGPGNPADVILAVAETCGADLIVVGNKGMHGARRLLGSVPNAISHRAACDLLIVSTT